MICPVSKYVRFACPSRFHGGLCRGFNPLAYSWFHAWPVAVWEFAADRLRGFTLIERSNTHGVITPNAISG